MTDELQITQCNQSLSGDWIAIATFYPHRGKISGIGRTEELAKANAKKRMEDMKKCYHLFVVSRTSREKECEKCKIIIKEY